MPDEIKPGDKLRDMRLPDHDGGDVWTVTEVIRHPTQDRFWVQMERVAVVTRTIEGDLIGKRRMYERVPNA